ncbi:hypothetical protein ILUMI_05431 [Ignelater luminosus]|uniref:Uncharacterized protein n=1 Tax=Ignelater luminosus TaxID=2038154 RepID=A0A8K0D744_IGNLU|nr:hypothetical protein ILUMI_05431 [Ignelater luminosus]
MKMLREDQFCSLFGGDRISVCRRDPESKKGQAHGDCWTEEECLLLEFMSSFGKILVILTNRTKFSKALDKLQQEPFLPNRDRGGEEEEKLVNECIWITSIEDTSNIPKKDFCTVPWQYLKQSLAVAVDYHLAILDVAAEMELVLSKLLLMAFLATISELCFEVYMASITTSNGQLVRHLAEACSALMQVALYSYWGQQVTEQSQLVGNAIYESNFVGTDLRFQRAVAFIIRRTQTPTVITAGKFTNIGLATFTWVYLVSSFVLCLIN